MKSSTKFKVILEFNNFHGMHHTPLQNVHIRTNHLSHCLIKHNLL